MASSRRTDLADALLTADYDILHFSGHSAVVDGRGYVALNCGMGGPIGSTAAPWPNWRYDKPIKLVVLNVCGTDRGDDGRGFQGLAPQTARAGVPVVVTMQFPITDEAAATFAQEFYKRLCAGEDAGQVDVAVIMRVGCWRRCMPATIVGLRPGHDAADGVIYRLPEERWTSRQRTRQRGCKPWPTRCKAAWRRQRIRAWPTRCGRSGGAHSCVPRRTTATALPTLSLRCRNWRAAGRPSLSAGGGDRPGAGLTHTTTFPNEP